jgi:kinesin family protein 18/19
MSNEAPFNVVLRLRPLVVDETRDLRSTLRSKILHVAQNVVTLKATRDFGCKEFSFIYDHIFPEDASNEAVYQQALRPLILNVFEGYNATCFAYGMTGAGKTYTVHGDYLGSRQLGLTHLAFQDCFAQLEGVFTIHVSYLEIYNEQVRDLLAETGKSLMVVEDPVKGVVVPELSELLVQNVDQVNRLIDRGNRLRTMAATSANQFSTRSHAILQMTLEQREGGETQTSKLYLIDLAGSERACATENRGQRMIEGASINRSLLALGSCINILSDPRQSGKYVPYRDSKLTRLLKDSLGGNTKTLMVACVCGATKYFEETLNTLRYASRARNIKHKVEVNMKQQLEYGALVESLTAEISNLRSQLQRRHSVVEIPVVMDREADSEELERLSHQLITNFEEHWELKQSITEIDALNKDNQERIREILSLRGRVDDLEELRYELEGRQNSIKANEESRGDLMQALYKNMREKTALQQTLGTTSSKQRQFLEVQLDLRALKLEKVDLHLQNRKIKEEAKEVRRQSEQKDLIILDMQQQLDSLKLKLSSTHLRPESVQPQRNQSDEGELIKEHKPSGKGSRRRRKTPASPVHVKLTLSQQISPVKFKISPLNEARSQVKLKATEPAQSSVTFLSNYVALTRPTTAPRPVEHPRAISQSPTTHKQTKSKKAPSKGAFSSTSGVKASQVPVQRYLSLYALEASLNHKILNSKEAAALVKRKITLTDIQQVSRSNVASNPSR